MTPTHIRGLRKKMKLSPTDFGVALGLAEKSARITVWRREAEKRKPSAQSILLMRQIATSRLPLPAG